MKPKILLVNDDGIHALGIRALYEALAPISDLWIVAPSVEQSAVGLSVTIRTPLMMDPVTWEGNTPAMKVNGTPADCVRLALNLVLHEKPDLIVSGINRGSNAGRNLLYSGTVGGVIEGTIRGVPGIAFSCEEYEKPNYEETKPYIQSIVQHIIATTLPRGSFLNVNFPAKNGIQGIKLARQGRSYVKEKLLERKHPEGNSYYWTGFSITDQEETDQTDIFWLKKGYIAAVPIHVDELTDHTFLNEHKETFERIALPTLSV